MIKRNKKPVKKKAKPRGRNDIKFMKAIGELAADANKHNKWWTRRSKHGRDTLFESPQLLLEAFNEYANDNLTNPDHLVEWRDKGLRLIPVKRVFLMDGFLRYCGTHKDYWHEFKESKKYANSKEWRDVVKLIDQTIREDKMSGIYNGTLNANVGVRDLKLSENISMEVSEHRKAAGDLFPDDKDFKNNK